MADYADSLEFGQELLSMALCSMLMTISKNYYHGMKEIGLSIDGASKDVYEGIRLAQSLKYLKII